MSTEAHRQEQFLSFYGLLESEEFIDIISKLKIYSIFLKEEMRPYESETSVRPTHPERIKKYLREKKEAEKNIDEAQKLFKKCGFKNYENIKKITQIIPIKEGDCQRRKCKSLIKNIYHSIFGHNFADNSLASSILGFGTLDSQRVQLIECFDEVLLLMFKISAEKKFNTHK